MKLFQYFATASLFLACSIASFSAHAANVTDTTWAECRRLAGDDVDVAYLAHWRDALAACQTYLKAVPDSRDARYFTLASQFNLQQYEPALAGFEALAAQGHAPSMVYLATAYANGKGRQQDFDVALSWLRKAWKTGDARSAEYLGEMYRLGWGVAQDFATARFYFELADELGYIPAKRSLAWFYIDGAGVPINPKRGFELLSIAAQQGNDVAAAELAYLSARGIGTEKNVTRAVAMFDDMVRSGSVEGMRRLARYYLRDGDKIQKKTAVELLEKAVALGDGDAMKQLADVYIAGKELPRDFAKAESLLDEAIGQGTLAAYYGKGMLFLKMPDRRYGEPCIG